MSLAEFNDYALATMEAYHDDLADQIHSGSPTRMFLEEAGIVETMATEGPSYVRPLLARDTNEPLWFKYADEHTFSPSDTSEAARFRYYNVRLPITITEEELKENRGTQKRLDLLGLKVRSAELTMRDRYNKALIMARSCYSYLYGANSANLPDPIPAIFGQVPGTGTAASYKTYGEILRSTGAGHATFWRAQNQPYGAAASLSTGLRSLYFTASREGFRPSLCLTNQPGYEALGKLLLGQVQRRTDVTGGVAPKLEAGWDGLMYFGAQIRWDPDLLGNIGDGTSSHGVLYFMNKEFWGLVEDDEWNWLLLPFEGPKGNQTQLTRQSYILHRCSMYHDNPRLNGVLFDMSTAAGTT